MINEKLKRQAKDVTITLSPRLAKYITELAEEVKLDVSQTILSILEYLMEDEDVMCNIFPCETN